MGLRTVAGVGGGSDIEWNVGVGLPEGLNAYISYAPHPDGSKNANKGVSGATDNGLVNDQGWDIVLTHNALVDGLNVFTGYSEIGQTADVSDRESWTIGATYAVGGATIGYQHSKDKNVGAGTYYENDAYAISFSVNDNLAISYGVQESDKVSLAGTTTTTLDGDSLQISYTVGGASIKVADSSVDNQNYVAGTNREGRIVALTLAF